MVLSPSLCLYFCVEHLFWSYNPFCLLLHLNTINHLIKDIVIAPVFYKFLQLGRNCSVVSCSAASTFPVNFTIMQRKKILVPCHPWDLIQLSLCSGCLFLMEVFMETSTSNDFFPLYLSSYFKLVLPFQLLLKLYLGCGQSSQAGVLVDVVSWGFFLSSL